MTFFVAGGALISSAIVWFIIMSLIELAKKNGEVEDNDAVENKNETAVAKRGVSGFFLMTLIFVGVTAIANGFIKDGINNWLPKLLRVEFGVPDSLSIILTLLLPVFSVFGSIVARRLYLRLRDHMLTNGILYSVSFALALLVFVIYPMKIFFNEKSEKITKVLLHLGIGKRELSKLVLKMHFLCNTSVKILIIFAYYLEF